MTVSPRAILSGALLLGTLAGSAYTAFAVNRVRAFRDRKPKGSGLLPPITVLKPLHGDEPRLYENLISFCEQDYPVFQIVFGTKDRDDAAVAVARRVIERFPQRDLHLVAGSDCAAANPKIANLAGMIRLAKHDLLVIADSDIQVDPNYLREVAACFAEESVGAATCLYGAKPFGGIAAQLGAMFVNDQFAPSVLVALALEPLTYCFGATMAVRRDVLERIGGLETLGAHLGDDYALGRLVAEHGHEVALCANVVQTTAADRSLRELWAHELRWARTIRAVRPAGYAGSVVTYALPLALGFALVTRSPFSAIAAVTLAAALRTWLHYQSRKTFAPHTKATPWLIPLRDAFGIAIWIASFFGDSVRWRARHFAIGEQSRMTTSD